MLYSLIENELLSNYQYGFVLGWSCMMQLLRVFDMWTMILDEGGRDGLETSALENET